MKCETLIALCVGTLLLAGCDRTNPNSSSNNPRTPSTPTNETVTPPPTAPDNSGINTRDRGGNTAIPADAGQNKSDVQMTADIRKQIMAGNFSVNAQNVKVVVLNGKVTLRGPVQSSDEKDKIGAIAANVAGQGNVDNQLEVAAGATTQPNGM